MNDRDFMRYSRQILLDDIALDGQQKLLDSQVLIIGLGGWVHLLRCTWRALASGRWYWQMTTMCI